MFISMDWFKGKSTGNHRFSHLVWGFPVNFPLNQSIDHSGHGNLVKGALEEGESMWRQKTVDLNSRKFVVSPQDFVDGIGP